MNRVLRRLIAMAFIASAALAFPAESQLAGPGRPTAGIFGGVTFPRGDLGDEVGTGWHAGALVKMRLYGALDVRLDGTYNVFGEKEFRDSVKTVSTYGQVSFGTLVAVLNLAPDSAAYPTDRANSPYLIGGIGRYHLDYDPECSPNVPGGTACDNVTFRKAKWYNGINIGGGVTVPFFHGIRTYVEARYHRISRSVLEGGTRSMVLLSAGVKIR